MGDRLYTMFAEGDDELAASFRTVDGSEIWRRRLGQKFIDQWGNGPRSTPTIEEGIGYFLSSEGELFALRSSSGEVVWQLSMTETFGPVLRDGPSSGAPFWGHCSSPLVVGELLIIYAGAGAGRSLVALDKKTGQTRWTLFDHPISLSSPVVLDLAGRRQIVLTLPHEVAGVSLEGEVLWRHPWARFNVALPVLLPPDRIFLSAPNDVGAALLQIRPDRGGFAVEELWRDPRMRNNWQSSVFFRDSILGYDNATLKSLDEDGKILWAKRGLGKGTVIAARELLILLSDRGVLTLGAWSAEEFRELGRTQALDGTTWTAPSLSAGRLFLRSHTEMVCFDLRG